MALHETVLEYVRKEIEGEAYNRMELYKAVEEIPEKEKKQALRRICSLIKKSILESVLPVAECYTRWLKTERSFQCVLSALNIQQGRIKKLTSLSLHKTVTRSVLQLTKIKKDEEIRTLVQMVRDSMQGEKEEQTCRALRIQLFLLTRIKEEKRVEREILRVYTSAAEVHIQEVKEAYKAHTPSDIKMKIENVKKTPGLFIFAKGLTKKLKRSVQQQIAALAIDRSVYSAQDVLVLLKSNEVGAVSEILNCKLPKQSRLSLRDMVQAAIFQYTAENRYDKLLEIYKKPWTGRAPQIVKSIVACISKEAVKSSLEEYCRIVTSKIRLLFLSKDRNVRAEKTLLKIVAEEVSNTSCFENMLVLMVVNEILRGVSVKRVKKVLNIVNKTWKYQLKRRVEGLLKDFSDAEATEDRRVSLIHANSFRWPASLEKLDLRDIPELSNLKRAIENSKKKNKIKLEWMDSLSTVEIEVNEEVALLSLFQYWIVLKIIQDSEIPEEMLEKKLKTYKQHIAPFISQGILQIDSSRGVVEQSVHFSNASQWRNLLPQYEIEESTEKVTEHKKLINLSIDSYVTRQLKSVSPQKEDDIIRKITEKQNANKDTVQKRIDSLVSKGLLSKSQKENSSVAWLEYIP